MKRIKVLITPSAYKGSLSSGEVCQGIKAGLEKRQTPVQIKCLPLADGGDGTIAAIQSCSGGTLTYIEVRGPLNNPVSASWLKLDDLAFVELANCCGLATIKNQTLQPLLAHTYGLGQVMQDCLAGSCKKIIIGLGGSASTDGGTGALTALGIKFIHANGQSLSLGGGFLAGLHSIDLSGIDERLLQKEIEILTDVRSPLLGQTGAAAIFGPQKGASQQEIDILEKGLTRLAKVIKTTTKVDLKELPGAGAAGGTAFGLASLLGASISPGFSKIAQLIKLEQEIKNADLVITAEGKLDSQSFNGKATGELARLCKKLAKPLVVFPALVEDKIQWQQFGITAVYSTALEGKYCTVEDITNVVSKYANQGMYQSNIINGKPSE